MGIFRQFPYSNFHDMNMDELIRTVKEIKIGFEKGKEEYKKDITEMFNYIKEYLYNIHIPTKTSELTNDSGFITSNDIPAVNNGKLTIQKNGTDIDSFYANQSENTTINVSVPTKTSDLNNDSGFITSNDIPAVNNGVLTIKRNGANVAEFSANQSGNTTADITIPTVSNGELTIQRNGTTVKTFTANQSSNVTANISVPVNVSELTNDSGFVTATPAKIPITNQIPAIISEAIFNGGYYTVGDIVIVQISGTVSGTFAANDYWSAASGLPEPKDCPVILQVNSTGNDHIEASAVVNTSGGMVIRSGSTALTGKTITIIGAYIKA